MGSLRLRLAIGGALAIAAALIVAAAGLAILFERYAARALAADLDVHLRQLAGAVAIDPSGHLVVAREPADPRFTEPLSGLYWQADDGRGGALRSRSLWDMVLALPATASGEGAIRRSEIAGPRGRPALLSEWTITIGDGADTRRIRLATAADLDEVARSRDAFMRDLIPAVLALALVLGLAAYIQITLGLKPLERIRRGVEAVRERRADRLPARVPMEVRPVVEEVNALLAAQEDELRRARDRAADLAHGLKTPLAALAGDAARLRERGDAETAGKIEALGSTMLRHVERELARARMRGRAAPGRTPGAAARSIVASLFATIGRTPDGRRVSLECEADAATLVPLDPDDLTEALGNLIENAARHARSRVRVSTQPGGGLSIEDDGPGVPAEFRPLIVRRGGRLDEAGAGAGLGLAIVQDILAAYGWALELGDSPLGGLKATIAPAGVDE